MNDLAQQLGLGGSSGNVLELLGEAGYMWHYLGQGEKAAAGFEALELLLPKEPVGPVGLTEVALRAGRHKDAQRHISEALRRGAQSPQTLAYIMVLRGDMHLAAGKPRQAREDWTRAGALDPSGSGHALA